MRGAPHPKEMLKQPIEYRREINSHIILIQKLSNMIGPLPTHSHPMENARSVENI